jgi:short-subunit dehydrogenase
MKNLDGKTALITGAASGIGRAIALELARQRVNVFLVDRDQPRLADAADEARKEPCQVIAHVADLARADDVQGIVDRLLKRWNGVDILVNNAGNAYYGPTHQMTPEQWDLLLTVNLLTPIELVRKLLPSMLGRSEAHILNVCSVAGLLAAPRLAAYHTTKYGMVGFSESLRAEYGPRGLGVTALCPGFVRTSLYHSVMTPPGTTVPTLPSWCTTSAEHIGRRAVRAIRRSEGTVVVTPLAHFLWRFKRFGPGVLDWMQQFRRRPRASAVIEPSVLSMAVAELAPAPREAGEGQQPTPQTRAA